MGLHGLSEMGITTPKSMLPVRHVGFGAGSGGAGSSTHNKAGNGGAGGAGSFFYYGHEIKQVEPEFRQLEVPARQCGKTARFKKLFGRKPPVTFEVIEAKPNYKILE